MLKRWCYAGVYGPRVMLCAGTARIGPAPQAWWAVWDRQASRLTERTRLLVGLDTVRVSAREVSVADGDVEIRLTLEADEGIEVYTPDPGGYVWTRKHEARARGDIRVGNDRWEVDGPALVDDSAGYHPRHTVWRWSAGTGRLVDGAPVTWNLVEGIHDSPRDSERTLWVNGEPRELAAVRFAPDLSAVEFDGDGRLAFLAEAARTRDDNLLVVRSRYRQPFGRFTGTFPGGRRLAEGWGVMESHDALW